MYFPVGLPRIFNACSDGVHDDREREEVLCVSHSCDGKYLAVCCPRSVYLWQVFPLVRQIPYRRSTDSLGEHGLNQSILWRNDRNTLAVALSKGYIQLLAVDDDEDSTHSRLFDIKFKGSAAPSSGVCILSDVQAQSLLPMGTHPSFSVVPVSGAITSMINFRLGILVSTTAGIVEELSWDNPFPEQPSAIAISA